jgi:hypothetical protein
MARCYGLGVACLNFLWRERRRLYASLDSFKNRTRKGGVGAECTRDDGLIEQASVHCASIGIQHNGWPLDKGMVAAIQDCSGIRMRPWVVTFTMIPSRVGASGLVMSTQRCSVSCPGLGSIQLSPKLAMFQRDANSRSASANSDNSPSMAAISKPLLPPAFRMSR